MITGLALLVGCASVRVPEQKPDYVHAIETIQQEGTRSSARTCDGRPAARYQLNLGQTQLDRNSYDRLILVYRDHPDESELLVHAVNLSWRGWTRIQSFSDQGSSPVSIDGYSVKTTEMRIRNFGEYEKFLHTLHDGVQTDVCKTGKAPPDVNWLAKREAPVFDAVINFVNNQ